MDILPAGLRSKLHFDAEFKADLASRKIAIKNASSLNQTKKCPFCFNLFSLRPCRQDLCRQTCESCVKFISHAGSYEIYLSRKRIEQRMHETYFCSTCAAEELAVDPYFHEVYFREIGIDCQISAEVKLIFDRRRDPSINKCRPCGNYFQSRFCSREFCCQTCEKCISSPAADYAPPIYINQEKLREKMMKTKLCSSCATLELLDDPDYHTFCYEELTRSLKETTDNPDIVPEDLCDG